MSKAQIRFDKHIAALLLPRFRPQLRGINISIYLCGNWYLSHLTESCALWSGLVVTFGTVVAGPKGFLDVRSCSRSCFLGHHLAWDGCSPEHGLCLHLLQGGNAWSLGDVGTEPVLSGNMADQRAMLDTDSARLLQAKPSRVFKWLQPQGIVLFWQRCKPPHPDAGVLETIRVRYRFDNPGFKV